MINLLIGNVISLVAVWFTAMSSWSKDRRNIYLNQVWQCLLLSLASAFFRSYTGIATLLLCAWRNYLASQGRLTKRWSLIILGLIVFFGLLVNNRGFLGYLLVLTNVIYTLGVFYTKRELSIKCNMILNMTLWMIYDIFIMDIPSGIADFVGIVTAVASLLRPEQNRKKAEHPL